MQLLRVAMQWASQSLYSLLAVSTSLAVSTGRKKLSRFALEFSQRLRASVRSFISIHQVAAATALLLLLMLLRAIVHGYSPGGAGWEGRLRKFQTYPFRRFF